MCEHDALPISVFTHADVINDKEAIIEGILYHLQNFRILHTFRSSLEVLWALILFCLFSSLFRSITLPAGL